MKTQIQKRFSRLLSLDCVINFNVYACVCVFLCVRGMHLRLLGRNDSILFGGTQKSYNVIGVSS